MNMKKFPLFFRGLLASLFASAFLAGQLGAQPIAFYDADVDGSGGSTTSEFPIVSPFNWSQSGIGSFSAVNQNSETIGGETTNYFRITSTSALGGTNTGRYYNFALNSTSPAFTDPNGWTFTSIARVPFADDNINTSAYMRVDDGTRMHVVSFINDAGFEGLGYAQGTLASAPTQLQAADISSDYVTVQMWYNPTLSETTVYLNGIVQGSFASSVAPATSSFQASWGRATGSGDGSDVYWNYTALEAGNTVVVPEVSSFALCLGAAALAGACILRRKR